MPYLAVICECSGEMLGESVDEVMTEIYGHALERHRGRRGLQVTLVRQGAEPESHRLPLGGLDAWQRARLGRWDQRIAELDQRMPARRTDERRAA